MTPIYNLFDLDEPAYMLNGRLSPADNGPIQVFDSRNRSWELPDELRPVLRYFTRLRTASEVEDAASELGIDDDDVAALVEHHLLLQIGPQSFLTQVSVLAGLKILEVAPRAPIQNRPGMVVIALPDITDWVTVIDEFSASVLAEATRPPVVTLGLALRRTAAEQQVRDHEHCWRRISVDLANLLRTGTAVIVEEPRPVPYPGPTADIRRMMAGGPAHAGELSWRPGRA